DDRADRRAAATRDDQATGTGTRPRHRPADGPDPRTDATDDSGATPMTRRCNYPAPSPDAAVLCDREANHDGPHRGYVAEHDAVIFWLSSARRPLVRLERDRDDAERWIVVDPKE